MRQLSALAGLAALLAVPAFASAAAAVNVVAAENFYGDIAQQIGGPDVKVSSILSNPDQDPHLFEASPSVAREISGAKIVVYNGIDYDPWMEKLLGAAKAGDRKTIVVADLTGHKTGDNPHLWYDQTTVLAYAQALADALAQADPAHQAGYEQRLGKFQELIKPIQDKIAALKERLTGTPVDRDRADLRLYVRGPRHAGSQHALPDVGDEQYRAERVRCRGLRERPEDASGAAADLQQPGFGSDGTAHGEAGQGIAHRRGRRDGDRAARKKLPGVDDERA